VLRILGGSFYAAAKSRAFSFPFQFLRFFNLKFFLVGSAAHRPRQYISVGFSIFCFSPRALSILLPSFSHLPVHFLLFHPSFFMIMPLEVMDHRESCLIFVALVIRKLRPPFVFSRGVSMGFTPLLFFLDDRPCACS